MTAPGERVQAELRFIRDQVTGVHGSLIATDDGFLVAHDLPDLEATAIAALAAATRSLASRATESAGRGTFREAVARGSRGYLAVYAAGSATLLAIVGTPELNIGMLHYQTREIVERIAACVTGLVPRTAPEPARYPAPAGTLPGADPASRPAPAGGLPGADPASRPAPAGGLPGADPAALPGQPARLPVRRPGGRGQQPRG